VRPSGHELHRALQELRHVERDLLDRQLARLELREVEDVIDDPEQPGRGGVDLGQLYSGSISVENRP
jgi:hypothetical protein